MGARLLLLSVLTLLVLPAAVRSQAVPDTTSPARYYPLNVGDQWQYEVERYYYNYCTPCRYKEVRDVTGTTVLGGQTYAVVRTRTFEVPGMPSPPPASSTDYVRFDPVRAIAVERSGSSEYPLDYSQCRLDEAFPAPSAPTRAISCPGVDLPPIMGLPTVEGGYGVEGFAAYKRFRYDGFGGQYTAYAADVGLVIGGGYTEIDLGTIWRLRYARVSGTSWGTPIVIFTDGEAGPAPVTLTVTVAPNPVEGRARLSVAVPTAGPVVVVVTDALGREVSRTTATVGAGTHAVDLSTSDWAAGVYVVRVTDAAGGVASRVVVRE